jgi:putative resolvase
MKLHDYARKVGVTYKTAWRWYKAGKLKGYQMDTGTIIVEADEPAPVTLWRLRRSV